MKEDIYIPKHAEQRIRQRCGISKRACQNLVEKAFTEGLLWRRAKGELLSYLADLVNSHGGIANNTRIYNYHVFLFDRKRLITIYHLPNKYKKAIDKIKSRRKDETKTDPPS